MPRLSSNLVEVDVPTLKSTTYGDTNVRIEKPRGLDAVNDSVGDPRNIGELTGASSVFSNYHIFRFKTVTGDNQPLTIDGLANDKSRQNVTATDLIANPIGASIFQPNDFLYVDMYGKVPLNRLLTLRRFAFPVVDDIFSGYQTEPDIARMLTFFDQDINKLSELLSFSLGMRWKELQSTVEQMNMHGPQSGIDGYVGNVLKYVDPVFGKNAIRGEVANTFNPVHDNNKVYGAVDSIDATHIRDQGLNFEQEFSLTFKYEMRSFDGINGKAAFVDLLSQILVLCTNDAKFWGGARYWVGPRPTSFTNKLKFLSATSWDDFINKSHVEFKGWIGSLKSTSREDALSTLKSIANNVLNLTFGKILDKIGRAGIPYMNSLLTGSPVGLWHLTVGNPFNPIATIGNLICTNTTISFGDELGFDDFPTELNVVVTLKHATPRARAEVENMFNSGNGRTYFKPENLKVGSSKSSKINPKQANTFTEDIAAYFGKFDREAVLRNAQSVFSFEKNQK